MTAKGATTGSTGLSNPRRTQSDPLHLDDADGKVGADFCAVRGEAASIEPVARPGAPSSPERRHLLGRLIQGLVVGAGVVAAWCIVAGMGVMAYEVFCRYILGSPTDWALEVSTYLLTATVTLGGAYTLREQAHVGMELVYTRLSPQRRALAQRISLLTVLGFSAVLVWFGIEEARTAILFNETSLTPLAMPLVYPLSLVPIGGLLLAIQALELIVTPPIEVHLPALEAA